MDMGNNVIIKEIDKIWLNKYDIAKLYGPVSDIQLKKFRQKRLVTVANHPQNSKCKLYLHSDLEMILQNSIIPADPRQTKKYMR